MKKEIMEVFAALDYKIDRRRSPNGIRLGKFRKGWEDAVGHMDISYSENGLNKLTWQNLGYRLGKHFGEKTGEEIREIFDYLAQQYGKDTTPIVWSPVTGEDRLLQNYRELVGGRIYVEVPIGGPGGTGKWPLVCTRRRIDGIRLAINDKERGIFVFTGNQSQFEKDLKRSRSVDIIEVKALLNRAVIGQAIAGIDMF